MTSAAKANRRADIVDRLEAEIERRKETYPYSEVDMDMHVEAVTKDLKAEIERLRAALTEMLADLDDPGLIEISAATIARARQAVVNIHQHGEVP